MKVERHHRLFLSYKQVCTLQTGDLTSPRYEHSDIQGSPIKWPMEKIANGKTLSRHRVFSHLCVWCVCGVCVYVLCRVWLFATPWTVAHKAPLFMRFPRQEYWSGLPLPSPGYLSDPGIEPTSLTVSKNWQADSLPLRHQGSLSYKINWNMK